MGQGANPCTVSNTRRPSATGQIPHSYLPVDWVGNVFAHICPGAGPRTDTRSRDPEQHTSLRTEEMINADLQDLIQAPIPVRRRGPLTCECE